MTYNREQRATYGQNYIKNPALVRVLVSKLGISADDTVVEIGPGHGVWTSEFAAVAGKVVAVEIDTENVTHIKELELPNTKVLHLDALEFEPKWAGVPLLHGQYKTFGSIPYNISSQLIKKFLLKKPMPAEAYFVVQREFAERVTGRAGRSLVSTLIEAFYKSETVHHFNREDFSPVPSVDSVLVHFTLRSDVPKKVWENFGEYKDMLARGYTQPIKRIGRQLATELTADEWFAHFVDKQ